MNRKTLIAIVAVILIIALAIVAGINAGKKEESKPTSNTPANSNESQITSVSPTPEPTETPSPEPSEEPSPVPSIELKDTSKMSDAQKIDYAISIAKVEWQKAGIVVDVEYKYESILNNGKYMIAIKNGTAVVDYCYVDIKNGTGELERYK